MASQSKRSIPQITERQAPISQKDLLSQINAQGLARALRRFEWRTPWVKMREDLRLVDSARRSYFMKQNDSLLVYIELNETIRSIAAMMRDKDHIYPNMSLACLDEDDKEWRLDAEANNEFCFYFETYDEENDQPTFPMHVQMFYLAYARALDKMAEELMDAAS